MVKPPNDGPPSDIVRESMKQAQAAYAAVAYVQQDIARTEQALAIAIKRLREIVGQTLHHEHGHKIAQAALFEIEALQDQPPTPPA